MRLVAMETIFYHLL